MINQKYITPKGNIFEVVEEYDTHVVIQVLSDNNRLEMVKKKDFRALEDCGHYSWYRG